MTDADVVIAGGGPVGLTLAIDLGQRGISCVLVDKRPALGRLPKMERCNARTMEHYRRLGLADDIRAAGFRTDLPMDVFICVENIVRPPLVHHAYPSVDELRAHSCEVNDGSQPAEPYQLISQYTLEPLLRERAEATPGVSIVFGREVVDFEQDDAGVTTTVRHIDGTTSTVRSQYLVGCDGASSSVRAQLGIELRGESLLEMRQALFACPELFERIPIGKGRHYHVADEQQSFLIVQDDTRHFSLHATVESDEDMPELFRRIVGMPVEFETLYIGKWTQRLMVADRYREGRVLLAGDAVHLVIPTGGLGMNTGIGDAIDLAWKLAATVHGWAGEELLDSYEGERRPIGLRNVAASTKAATGRRTWRAMVTPEIAADTAAASAARDELARVVDREQRWSNDLLGIEMGYRYEHSPLVVADPSPDHPDPNSFRYTPTTAPGARLPHLWLEDGSAVQDHLSAGYTLLRLDPQVETAGMEEAFARQAVPLAVYDLRSELAREVYGFRLLLLRPDLHITWRGDALPQDPHQVVAAATGHATFRNHQESLT